MVGPALLAVGPVCVPYTAHADDAGMAVYPTADSAQMRVATIGYRLAAANVTRCPRLIPLTGLILHDLGAYDADMRAAAKVRYGLDDGFGVLGVVSGSPADRAGLVAGDEIVGVADARIASLTLPAIGSRASYVRIEAFVDLLAARLRQGPVAVDVRRGAATRTVQLPAQSGCGAYLAVLPGMTPDAWSDSRYAVVTQGLADAAGDDELAFALAHEMSHVVLGHAAESHGILGLGGRRSRERESDADRLGLALMIAARYDPAGADALLARLARAHAPAISLTHPSVRSRIAALHTEAARIYDERRDPN